MRIAACDIQATATERRSVLRVTASFGGIVLLGVACGSALHSRIFAALASEGFVQVEQAKGGISYISASDPRIPFGLGKRTKIPSLEITGPGGQIVRLTNVPINQIISVREGTAIIPRQFPKIPSTQ